MPTVPHRFWKDLCSSPTEGEILHVIQSMAAWKSPGPDGMLVDFFQKFWPIIKNEVVSLSIYLFSKCRDINEFNFTFLCVIPKVKSVSHPKDFRRISLCNVIYKILSKLLENRLAKVLSSITEENQGSFIQGRGTVCNAVIVLELIDSILKEDPRLGRDLRHVAIKLNMIKAYDRVNWDFLEFMMNKFSFSSRFT